MFFLTAGTIFNTIDLIVLTFDYLVIFSYVSKTEQYSTYRKNLSEFTSQKLNSIKEIIPKYNENNRN